MSEHLAFEQFFAERRTVDRHKILFAPLAVIMYSLRKDLLPVPVSPVSNTGTSVTDTFCAKDTDSFSTFDSPG